jgi:hypothetical protein
MTSVLEWIQNNIWWTTISPIVFFILKKIYIENNKYKKIIDEFIIKLPPSNKQSNPITQTDPIYGPTANILIQAGSAFDMSNKPSISQNDIDTFFNQIEKFEYKYYHIFKNHYRKVSLNLLRFNGAGTSNVDEKLQLKILQDILEIEVKNLGFFNVLRYQIKLKFNVRTNR